MAQVWYNVEKNNLRNFFNIKIWQLEVHLRVGCTLKVAMDSETSFLDWMWKGDMSYDVVEQNIPNYTIISKQRAAILTYRVAAKNVNEKNVNLPFLWNGLGRGGSGREDDISEWSFRNCDPWNDIFALNLSQ